MPTILDPFHPSEATDPHKAARAAQVTPQTIRRWVERYGIGRKVGGRFYVSRVALAMWMAGDVAALALYHGGDRASIAVRLYFDRMECQAALSDCVEI